MKNWIFIIVSLSLVTFSCNKKADDETAATIDAEEMAQQIGETMAAIDEGGGSSGQLAFMKSDIRTFARLTPNAIEKPSLMSLLVPTAEAATCSAAPGFSGCVNNVITRNFGSCTIGTATVSGSVVLTYVDGTTDNTCSVGATGNQVYRDPNYTVSVPSGAQLAVTKTGTWGQTITKLGIGQLYSIVNDGINRKLTFNGVTVLDVTTTISVSDALVVSGTNRSGRTLNAGTIVIADNLVGKTCTLSPTNVTWNNACNCAISGSWAGSCDNGTSADVTITGCGTADIVINGESKSINFDRCY